MEIWQILLILATGLFTGVVNTLAGGGSLLTLPLLILVIGLPSTLANGTNRVAIWIQCIAAVASFRKRGVSQVKMGFYLSIPAVIGAIIGSQIAITMPDRMFNGLLAIMMLIMVAFIAWKPKARTQSEIRMTGWRMIAVPVTMFFIGLYGGILQAGVGLFLIAVFTLMCNVDLIYTSFIKVFIIACYLTVSLLIFAWNGQVDWVVGLTLAAGNGLGGWFGSKIAVEKGEKVIRTVLLISVLFMAFKLLGLFDLILTLLSSIR